MLTTVYPIEAERVVANAVRQRRRGRRPGMSYKDIRNPRKALAAATDDLLAYEPSAEESFDDRLLHALALANLLGVTRYVDGEDFTLKIQPGATLLDALYHATSASDWDFITIPEAKKSLDLF